MNLIKVENSSATGGDRFHSTDYLKITIFGFALAALWSCLHSIIIPMRLLDFVPEAEKNTYLGILTFTGLILAMLVQPIAGAISDRSRWRWGHRRPYILLGTALALVFLPGIGLSTSYAAVFLTYCLLQIACNTAQGPFQAFIPDLVPQTRRGLASGVKSLLEIVGGIAFVALIGQFMDRYSTGQGQSWLWLAVSVPGIVLLGTMIATILTVKEKPGEPQAQPSLLTAVRRTFKIDVKGHPDFIWFILSRLFMIMAMATLQSFALYILKDVVGVPNPAAATGSLLMVLGACMLLVVYPAGRLSDRIGRRPLIAFSGLLGAFGVLWLLFAHTYEHALLCGGLLGISSGIFLSTNWALATDMAVEGEEARYMGLTNLATAGGAALARLIGPVVDFLNARGPGQGYSALLIACAIYFLLGSALLLKIREHKVRKQGY